MNSDRNNNLSGISIILPNYNGVDLLKTYLPSLQASINKSKRIYEIIVLDDCSTDHSVDFLLEHYPAVKIVQNSQNLGFSRTSNIGIAQAKYPYVCICNTDVKFEEDYFTCAFEYIDQNRPFALKGDILNYINNQYSNTDRTCELVFKSGLFRFKCNVEPNSMKFGFKEGQQFVGLGCCFIAERQKLVELGGYNEIFSPFYWEDSDLCIRAFKKGYKVSYVPDCRVYHYASSSISKKNNVEFRKFVSNRNKFLFTWIHVSRPVLRIRHALYLIINIFIRWLKMDWIFYKSLISALSRYTERKQKLWSSLIDEKRNAA